MADKSCGQSAAATVLELPELLDNILYHVYPEHSFHHYDDYDGVRQSAGLLRVCKFWFSIAVKYAWGTLGGSERPSRFDLELLVDDPHRLKIYAKHIENLYIDNYGRSPHRPTEEQDDQSRFHKLLPLVELPRLRRLTVNCHKLESRIPFSDPATHLYLRESLTHLKLYCVAPSPSFWTLLKDQCPNIKGLYQRGFRGDAPSDPAALEAFQEFLESSNKLREVWLSSFVPFDMSRSLLSLAQQPLLSLLLFGDGDPFIRKVWIELLLKVKPDAFSDLTSLRLNTTNEGFRLLEPNLVNLRNLDADFEEGEEILRSCFNAPRNMPHLQDLSVCLYPKGIIEGEELLSLAQHCPKLKSIRIHTRDVHARDRGVSDSVIKAMSNLLPDLTCFVLHTDGSLLTEQTLLYFGQHCKALSYLKIPGTVDLTKLAKVEEARLFPSLTYLEVVPDHDERILHVNTHEEVCAIPGRISLMMPKIQGITAPNNIIEVPSNGLDKKTQYNFDWALKEYIEHGGNPFMDDIGGKWPRPSED